MPSRIVMDAIEPPVDGSSSKWSFTVETSMEGMRTKTMRISIDGSTLLGYLEMSIGRNFDSAMDPAGQLETLLQNWSSVEPALLKKFGIPA